MTGSSGVVAVFSATLLRNLLQELPQEADTESVVTPRIEQPGQSIGKPALVEHVSKGDFVGLASRPRLVEDRSRATQKFVLFHRATSICSGYLCDRHGDASIWWVDAFSPFRNFGLERGRKMKRLDLDFHGPLAWVHVDDADFIFDANIAKNPGIYLWTVETPKGHLVWYVGQTRSSFRQRMKDHFKEQMSGSYSLNDPILLARGERKKTWPGYYGRNEDSRIPSFLDEMAYLCEAMVAVAKMTRFFVAPMNEEPKMYRRVEGGLGRFLRGQPGVVGQFMDDALRYDRPWRKGEDPWGLRIKCPPEVLGMPERIVFDEQFRCS